MIPEIDIPDSFDEFLDKELADQLAPFGDDPSYEAVCLAASIVAETHDVEARVHANPLRVEWYAPFDYSREY